MNNLQQEINNKQLEIVKQLDTICNKHNIKYYANGGTLIGCYRHNGFIPHDVDMDFLMTRENFNKFLKVVNEELISPYVFLSSYQKDFNYGFVNRIVDTSTTYFCNKKHENRCKVLGIPGGIFIDIFVFDEVPEDWDDRVEFANELNQIRIELNKLTTEHYNNLIDGIDSSETCKQFNEKLDDYLTLCEKYNGSGSSIVGDTTVTKFKHGAVWFKHWVEGEEIKKVKFEDIELPVPENGRRCLDNLYPNWDKIVIDTYPKKPFVDPYNSYEKYINGELIADYDFCINNGCWSGE